MGYRLLLLGLLVMSVGYTLTASQIPMDPWTAEELINAQTLPIVYGSLLTLVLLVALIRGASTPAGQSASLPFGRYLRLAGIGLLVMGFAILVGRQNLWLALGMLLLATSWWLGERRWLPMLTVAISVPLAGYLGIELGLGVYLPD